MTAHWISVKDGKWKLKSAVIGFKALSGGHSGENLGRYSVGLLDRVGIMDKTGTKLYTAMLDNTGNNNTTCKMIQDIHTRRGLEWNSDEQQLPYILFINFYSP
jgi:hypothetical protein